ncbi:MAG: GAF domain-containing SpoIIE family protein phosphatase [Verrucomicrobiota bacterium]|nr:GAF domain-containing SpoIIE family protein phosphatase [Verrucomicrobiota bacterium]
MLWQVLAFLFLVILVFVALHLQKVKLEVKALSQSRNNLIKERKVILEFLHDLGEACTDSIDTNELLKSIVHCSIRATNAKSSAIFLLNKETEKLVAEFVEGAFPPPYLPPAFVMPKMVSNARHFEQIVKSLPIPLGVSVIGEVAQKGDSVLITDGINDSRIPHFPTGVLTEALNIETMMAVPLKYRDEVLGVMAVVNKKAESAFTRNDLTLFSAMADQAAYALHNATMYQFLAEKKRYDHELQIARDIQTILLPEKAPHSEVFDIHGINLPALAVGGDYFDFIQINESGTKWGIAIADVSGKGVPGAMIMAMCRSVLRSYAKGCDSASKVLREVNRHLFPDIKEDMFISMEYVIFDSETRQVSYARAGHEPPLFYCASTQKVGMLDSFGMALGIDSGEVFDTVIEDKILQLQPGDCLVLYTDGVTEAQNVQNEEFGRDALVEALKTAASQGSARQIVENVTERLDRFVGNRQRYDDITLIALKMK